MADPASNAEGRHIVITGAMGVGKTTVGRLLAEDLDLPLLDSDEGIEERTGRDAADIAERDGVKRLHELELEVFLEACSSPEPAVIAPASSVVDHREGRTAMTENLTIWLTAPDSAVAVRQGSGGGHRRPIDALERAELRERRMPHLEAVASLTVDTGSATPAEIVGEIKSRIEAGGRVGGIEGGLA